MLARALLALCLASWNQESQSSGQFSGLTQSYHEALDFFHHIDKDAYVQLLRSTPLFYFPFGSLGNHQHGKNNSQERSNFHIFALAFDTMVFTVSICSHETHCSPQLQRKAFALQNRKGSFFIFKWETSYKNRQDGLLKCPFLLLFLIIHVKPYLSSHI